MQIKLTQMKAIKIKEGIYWVGAIDWNMRNFHGYLTQRGTTYNAYLVIDEKITLIDTVKNTVKDQMLERIKDIIDPSKIDVVVSNHVEMDHSGSLPEVMELCPNAELITSPQGEKGLPMHYHKNWKFTTVKTGDKISIGKRSLEFVNTPMVHWPDNMVCYMAEEKILFSNDSFGQHYATSNIFDFQNPKDIILYEAKKYYANIVMPYAGQVVKEYNSIKDFDIEMICTSHGVIWKDYVKDIVDSYLSWVNNETKKKAIIVYDTMWKSTEKMAFDVVASAFETKGYEVQICNMQDNHESDVVTYFIDSEYIAVGSPTLNKNIMPNIAKVLTYLRGLSPGGRKAIAFGSYGWGGESIKQIEEYIEQCKFDLKASVKFKYVPLNKDLEEMKKELIEKL